MKVDNYSLQLSIVCDSFCKTLWHPCLESHFLNYFKYSFHLEPNKITENRRKDAFRLRFGNNFILRYLIVLFYNTCGAHHCLLPISAFAFVGTLHYDRTGGLSLPACTLRAKKVHQNPMYQTRPRFCPNRSFVRQTTRHFTCDSAI